MTKTITTDTENIGLISVGSYETLLGEHLGAIPAGDARTAAWDEVGRLAVDTIAYEFGDAMRDLDGHFDMEFKRIWSPRFYNFETDAAIFDVTYDTDFEEAMLAYGNNADFGAFLKRHYTSHSGFISYTPNNLADWREEAARGRSQAVNAWIQYVLHTACGGNNESIWYGFTEQALEICGRYEAA